MILIFHFVPLPFNACSNTFFLVGFDWEVWAILIWGLDGRVWLCSGINCIECCWSESKK